jgi:carbon storage regulator
VLVLSRRKDEAIVIGDSVRVTVVDVRGDTVRLGIEAPRSVTVYRQEIYDAIQRENLEAARARAEGLDQLAGAFGARPGAEPAQPPKAPPPGSEPEPPPPAATPPEAEPPKQG